MFSVCGFLGYIEDWAAITGNESLSKYACKVHDRWHEKEPLVKAISYSENKANIDSWCADIIRAIDLWMERVYDSAPIKS